MDTKKSGKKSRTRLERGTRGAAESRGLQTLRITRRGETDGHGKTRMDTKKSGKKSRTRLERGRRGIAESHGVQTLRITRRGETDGHRKTRMDTDTFPSWSLGRSIFERNGFPHTRE